MFETTIHWVRGIEPNRLGLMARHSGGEFLQGEVLVWRKASVGIVVSLLEPQEIRALELKAEPLLCAEHGIKFRHFPIADRGIPNSRRDASALVKELHAKLLQGKTVVIHCRAGIGRTGLIAGCLLKELKVPSADILHILSKSRGVAMPDTSIQIDWVNNHDVA